MDPIHLVGLYTTRLPAFRWKARGYDWILVDSIGQPSPPLHCTRSTSASYSTAGDASYVLSRLHWKANSHAYWGRRRHATLSSGENMSCHQSSSSVSGWRSFLRISTKYFIDSRPNLYLWSCSSVNGSSLISCCGNVFSRICGPIKGNSKSAILFVFTTFFP